MLQQKEAAQQPPRPAAAHLSLKERNGTGNHFRRSLEVCTDVADVRVFLRQGQMVLFVEE